MSDFSFRYGSLRNGAYGSARTIVLLIIVPLIIIMFLSMILDSLGSTKVADLDANLAEIRWVFVMFGAVMAIVAFLKEFYPNGSVSHLVFGELNVGIGIFLGWSVLLDGRLRASIGKIGPDVDLNALFYLFVVMMAFGMLYNVGEWVDNKWAWRKRRAEIDGTKYVPIYIKKEEDPKEHRPWHDFRLRYGRYTNGIKMARKALLRYVIMPIAIIIIVKASLAMMEGGVADSLNGTLTNTMDLLFLIGIPMAACSFFKGFYPKGSFSRLTACLAIVLLLDLWVWFATLQGRFNADIGPARIDLNYQPYVQLLIVGISLWAIYYIIELISYRPDWIDQGFTQVDEGKARVRQANHRARKKAVRMRDKAEKGK